MESRGTAVAFFLIIGIICAGGYWSYQVLSESGGLLNTGETEVSTPEAIVLATALPSATPLLLLVTETPRFVPPTAAVLTPIPTDTPLPAITVSTPTPAGSPTTVLTGTLLGELVATETALVTPTATPTASPSPTVAETPTPAATATPAPPPPTATPAFPFRVALQQPNFERGCNGHYIYGHIRDSAGQPLAGVLVHAYDLYGNDLGVVASKEPPDHGFYDFPISGARDIWTVEIVDADGTPLSPPAQVVNTGNFVMGQEACWHQLDWVRQ